MRSPGGGDNLFLSSIVALKPDDRNEYVWHYQTTPGRQLGLHRDSAHDPRRHSEIGGVEPRKVLMQAPKNGFFYVLDRDQRVNCIQR